MGWLILVAYIAIGVWSTRLILRWCVYRWDSLPLTAIDLIMSSAMGLMWPIGLPMAYVMASPPRRNGVHRTDARLRKFAGLPPRKD